MRGWRIRRLAGPLALLVLLVAPVLPGTTGGAVQAHAQLVAGSPGPGEIVADPPTEIRLVFSERLESEVTSLDVVGSDGEPFLERAGTVDPDDRFALVATLPELPEGVYTVRWRSLSAADGHVVEGSYSFGVGDPESVGGLGGPDERAETATPPEVVARFAIYVGLMAAVGLAAFHGLVIRSGPLPATLSTVLAAGLALAAVASLALPIIDALESGSMAQITATRNGSLAVARSGVAGFGAVALLAVPARRRVLAAVTAGLAGLALHVAAGHASAVPSPVGVVGQLVHVAAAAVWLGGVAALVIAVSAPRLLAADGSLPPLRTLVPRFSAIALVAIGLLGMTGVLAAWTLAGALLDLDTAYGRTLLVKLVLAAGALGLGGLSYLDGGRGLRLPVGMAIRLRGEVGLALGALAVTGMLSTTTPTDRVEGVGIEPVPDAFGRLVPDVALELVPGRPGVNRLVVSTTDALGSASLNLAVELNRVDVASSSRIPLAPALGDDPDDGTARWTADAQTLPAASAWDANVLVTSDTGTTLSRQRFRFTLDEDGVADGRATRLVDPATVIAGILLVVGTLAVGLGIGGARLPRTEGVSSRVALVVGGGVAAVLGLGIGLDRLLVVLG